MIDCRAKPIIVCSFPRSGTHLTIDGLRHFFIETYRRQGFGQAVHSLYMNLDRLDPKHPYPLTEQKAQQILATCPKRVIIKTHCTVDIDQVGEAQRDLAREIITAADVAYVVRDVRPVMTSFMALRPMKFPDSPRDIATFLRTQMDGGEGPAANWAKHVSGWLDRPGVHVVKFEAMREDYARAISTLGEQLHLTSNRYPIQKFPKPHSMFENRIRRWLGIQNSSAIDNLRMAFETPDWKQVMTKGDFELIREQAGDVMQRLGYKV